MNGTNLGLTGGGNYFQAIRGPLLLMAVGILFAIDHMTTVSFTRTWPVLLILVGVLKLLERTAGARPLA